MSFRLATACVLLTVALLLPTGLAAQMRPRVTPRPTLVFGPSLTPTGALEAPVLSQPLDLLPWQEGSGEASPNAGDYFLGFAGAAALGVVAGGVLGYLGSQVGDANAQENVGGTVGGIALGGIGYTVGSVFGAYGMGTRRHPKDSMKSTWIGGLIGMLAGTAVGFAQPGDNLSGLWLPAALLGPPVGAVIGFFHE
jgi:hypothetical protein